MARRYNRDGVVKAIQNNPWILTGAQNEQQQQQFSNTLKSYGISQKDLYEFEVDPQNSDLIEQTKMRSEALRARDQSDPMSPTQLPPGYFGEIQASDNAPNTRYEVTRDAMETMSKNPNATMQEAVQANVGTVTPSSIVNPPENPRITSPTAQTNQSATQPFVPNTEGMGYFMGGSMPNNQLQDQGLARIQQESIAGRIPMAPSEYITTRQQAMRTAMQQGQPMVVSGEFPGMVMIGGTPRGGISSAPISGEGGFDPATARVARAYNQQINQMIGEGRTPTREEQVDLQRNLLQQERDAQRRFGGYVDERGQRVAGTFERVQQAGLAAGGGAGSPEANRARYEQNLADMARASEASYVMSTRGRSEQMSRERDMARAEALAAASGRLTPQQQMEEGRLERESRERIAGVEAGVRGAEAQDKAQTDIDNAAIGRATTINRSFVQRGISSAVSRINSMAGTSGLNENQKSMLKEFEGLQKEDAWKTFIEEMTKAQYFRSASPELEQWASRFDTALSIEDPEFFLNNMKTLYDAWSKT